MSWPVTYEQVEQAASRLRPLLEPTPLRRYPALDRATGCRVLVKHENHQPTGAFKVRNGLAALTGLPPAERDRGVVAATRGNHGLGVAYAGRLLGVEVTVCVPHGNNPDKNQAIQDLGARLVVEGRDYDESLQVMQRLVRRQGLRAVHSTQEPLVVAGAGTLTLEALQQAAELDQRPEAVVLAVGGGSQAVGALTVLRHQQRLGQAEVPVFGVQAAGAPAIHDAWHAGHPLALDHAETFADGVATRSTYDVTFGALLEGLEDFVTVTEAQIAAAVRLYLDATHNLAEGAGALGLAGLCKLRERLAGKTVLVVLSGGNIDRRTLQRVLCGEL